MTTHFPVDRIGKYELTDVIGEGAMGVVYRARDPVLERYVAIKLMSSSVARDEQLRGRFLREAQAAGSLQHPHIISIYDFGEVESHLYIAMEYIPGADLSEIIDRRDPIPVHGKLDIILDILDGLAYAHSRRIVHRDIKPANIRVSEQGHAKLMDFGIAHLSSSNLTKSGMLIGTPNYMAPEQVTGGEVTPATDVFAMGAVLYEFLTLARPFQGQTLHEVLYKVVSEDPPPLNDMVPGLPRSLEPIVRRALAKDATARYAAANALLADLAEARLGLSGGASHSGMSVRSTPLRTLAPTETVRSHRRRGPWLAGGAAAALAAGTALWLWAPWREGGWSGGAIPAVTAAPPAADSIREAARTSAPSTTGPAGQPAAPPPATEQRPPPSRVAAPSPETPRPVSFDSIVRPVRTTALEARGRAAAAGATLPELEGGDGLVRTADSLVRSGRVPDAIARLSRATTAWEESERVARQRARAESTARAAQPPARVEPPAAAEPAPPVVAPPPDPRVEIQGIVAAYARALESEDLARLRSVYVGLTPEQERGWQQFFRTVRNLRARLEITQLDLRERTAMAHVGGVYEYENESTGRHETQTIAFQATLERAGDRWQLVSVR